jgi:hypothetical protein
MAAPTPIDEELIRARQALARWHTQIVAAEERVAASELKCQKYHKAYSYIHVQWIKRARKFLEKEKIQHGTRVRDLEWEGEEAIEEDAKKRMAIALSLKEAEEGVSSLEALVLEIDEVEKGK